MIKVTAHVKCMEESRITYGVLVGKPEGKRPLGRPRRNWEYCSKMEPKEGEWERVDGIDLARVKDKWLAVVKTVMSLRIA